VTEPALIRYSVPWDVVFSLTPHLRHGTRENIDTFTRRIVERMHPAPWVEGVEHLPVSPRFVLVANHYQRPGLWILHTAAALTQAIRQHYAAVDYSPATPPVRWMVTANWPPLKIGPWKLPSPGDWLLPRVAHALHCYPVTFAGTNPEFTARTIRRLLKESRQWTTPLGIFPEGAAAKAGEFEPPLPGVDRLIAQLAKLGLPVVPALVSEAGRFVLRFGPVIPPPELLAAGDAASLALERVRALASSSTAV
jgi:1-acyl-sn-glycerol-3-phosphate acyltransferase